MVEDLQSILTLIATGAGIYVAVNGLRAWKRELTGRRDIELCQKVIESFYEAEQKIGELRSVFNYELESETRPRREGESEEEKRLRDLAFIPVARFDRQMDFWTEFFSLKFRMRALFGTHAVKAYNKVDECLRQFRAAAVTRYHGIRGSRQEIRGEDLLQLERVIWQVGDSDPISDKMHQAIKEMEDICVPIVRSKPTFLDACLRHLQSAKGSKKPDHH